MPFSETGGACCRFATASMLVDHHHSHHHSDHFHDEDVLAALMLPSGSVIDLKLSDEVTDGVQLGGATVVMWHLARISRGDQASVLLEGAVTLCPGHPRASLPSRKGPLGPLVRHHSQVARVPLYGITPK